METWMIVAIVAVLLLWVILTNNKFRKIEVKINQANSTIETALETRFDQLKQVYNSTMNYLDNEQKMVLEAAKYRAGMSVAEMAQAEKKFNESMSILTAVQEKYPEFTGKDLMLSVHRTVEATEQDLQAARRVYNSNVAAFNQMVVAFPSSIIAGIFNFKQKEFFKASEEKKQGFQIEREGFQV